MTEETIAKNRDLWDRRSTTNPGHTKLVDLGRRFTAIDAYRQIEAATEEWGPMGNWGLRNVSIGIVNEQAYLTGEFFHPGGSFSVINAIDIMWRAKGRDPRPDDDWGKKMMTNTITKSLSYMGFNTDVFFGMFDDDRYVEKMRQEFKAGLTDKGGGVSGATPSAKYPAWLGKTKEEREHFTNLRDRLYGMETKIDRKRWADIYSPEVKNLTDLKTLERIVLDMETEVENEPVY